MKLRRATRDDCRLLFEWANDPETRANSARTEEVGWDVHVRWFDQKMADPDCEIWIATDADGTPIGQVRFDRVGDEAEIGIGVAPERRREGIGSRLIEHATEDYLRRGLAGVVVAFIRHHNTASIKAFEKAGYEAAGEGEARGVTMLRYERRRSG